MKKVNKSILLLTLALITVIGLAGVAEARWGGPGTCPFGYGPASGMTREISPEARKIMEAAHEKTAPLALELRAKQKEFTAKLYGGADSKILDALRQDILRLQAEVTEARLNLQQELAKAGVPLQMGRGMKGGMGRGMGGCGACPRR